PRAEAGDPPGPASGHAVASRIADAEPGAVVAEPSGELVLRARDFLQNHGVDRSVDLAAERTEDTQHLAFVGNQIERVAQPLDLIRLGRTVVDRHQTIE